MKDEHVDDLIDLYALGALEPEEQATVDEHLDQCARCRARLDDAKQLVMLLAWTPDQHEPPPELRERTMRRIQQVQQLEGSAEPSWWQRLNELLRGPASRLQLVAAALVLLALLLGGRLIQLQQQLGTLQARLVEQEQEITTPRSQIAEQQRVVGILHSSGARLVSMVAQPAAPSAQGQMLVNPNSSEAYLVATLPPLPQDRVYQLWLVANGQRTSGGVFRPDEQGTASITVQAPRPLNQYQAAGITVEPAGGSPHPTTPPVLRTEF